MILLSVLFASPSPLLAQEWVQHTVGTNWTRIERYVFKWGEYDVVCQPDRRCELGSGIYFRGKPRGSRRTFSGKTKIKVFGVGELRVRAKDDKGTVLVQHRLASSDADPTAVLSKRSSTSWPLPGRPIALWQPLSQDPDMRRSYRGFSLMTD